MKKDLFNMVETPIKSIDVAAQVSTIAGVQVDLKNFHSALCVVDVDARTDGTHTITVQESDTSGSGFSNVAAADLIFVEAGAINSSGQIVVDGAADDDQVFIIGYRGINQFIKVTSTVTSASTGAIYGAMIMKGHKRTDGKINN